MRALSSSVLVGAAVLALGCSAASSSLVGDGGAPPPPKKDGGSMGGDSGGPGTDGGGPPPMGDAMVPPGKDSGPPPNPLPMSTNITIDVEPGDDAAPLLAAINAATTSVHVVMYLMDDQRWLDALANAKGAGKDVKVMLEHTPIGGSNQSAYSTLQGSGVPVQWAPISLTHEKAVIIDNATAWIMTMNMEASSPSNREYLATDTDAADVQEIEAIFEADYANHSYTPNGALVVAPSNARPKILALIATAKHSIDVEDEELSDYMVVNALAAAQQAGIAVRVVLSDADLSVSAEAMAITQLKGAGVKLVSLSNPYVHAKAVVVDGTSMYVGSANLTTGSMQYNREVGVLTATAAAVQAVASTITGDFGNGSAL